MSNLDVSVARSPRTGDVRVVTLNVWGRSGAWNAVARRSSTACAHCDRILSHSSYA
jgi:hypothetical protein